MNVSTYVYRRTHTHTNLNTHAYTLTSLKTYLYIGINAFSHTLNKFSVLKTFACMSAFGNQSRGRPEGSLFDSYYTEV